MNALTAEDIVSGLIEAVSREWTDAEQKWIEQKEYEARIEWLIRDQMEPETGVIYYLQQEGGGPIKIGLTSKLGKRLYDLQNMSAFPLVLLGAEVSRKETMYALESSRHYQFRSTRLHGEWFEDSLSLRRHLEGLEYAVKAPVTTVLNTMKGKSV